MRIDSLKLNNGLEIPQFGLGLYKMSAAELDAVIPAYNAQCPDGMLHIDGATVYGNQEALAAALAANSIPRHRLFLTDKLWDTEHDRVGEACRAALSRLNATYLDLYLIHWPFSLQPTAEDALEAERDAQGAVRPVAGLSLEQVWAQMERLVDAGLARSIGLSNFSAAQVQRVLQTCRVRPAVLQIECHPWLPQTELVEWCAAAGIVVEAYSPLATAKFLHDAEVAEVARAAHCTPAQACLAFARQRGLVALCKTGCPARLRENLESTRVVLAPEHMQRLSTLGREQRRLFDPHQWYRGITWP